MREFISAEGFVLPLVSSFGLLGLLLVDWGLGLFSVDLLGFLVMLRLCLVSGSLSELSELSDSDSVLELLSESVSLSSYL